MPTEPFEVPPILVGRRLLIVVCAGVSAYKVADLTSTLVAAGVEVRVVATAAAHHFIGPTTFQALTGHPVLSDLFAADEPGEIHIRWANWPDLVLVAPATADFLGKLADGRADDLASTILLASARPVVVAPAMSETMWEHPATRHAVSQLASRPGVAMAGPQSGRLASGDIGMGRLASHQAIVTAMSQVLAPRLDLFGLKVVVTAGGTREPVDAVRYLGNRSSGKMGHALAQAAARRGALVTLVTTVGIEPSPTMRIRRVETASEMADALQEELVGARLLLMAAAVSDFRPQNTVVGKLSRHEFESIDLHLVPTVDVLAEISADRWPNLFRVGFAAEVRDLAIRAKAKLKEKRLDCVIANDVSNPQAGFGSDHNEVSIFFADAKVVELGLMLKVDLAQRILDVLKPRLRGETG